jgi:hypothetical protein
MLLSDGATKCCIACSAARRQGTCINRASIRRNEIEVWIVEALRRELMAPDLVGEFIRTFNDEINRTRRDCGQRRHGLQRAQANLRLPTTTELAPASSMLRVQNPRTGSSLLGQ